MHRHIVFFWLDKKLSDADISAFETGLKMLLTDPDVAASSYGRPANSEMRDVVDGSYSFGMVADFADTSAHDRYQVSDIHKRFIADCADFWTRVQVYDIET